MYGMSMGTDVGTGVDWDNDNTAGRGGDSIKVRARFHIGFMLDIGLGLG